MYMDSAISTIFNDFTGFEPLRLLIPDGSIWVERAGGVRRFSCDFSPAEEWVAWRVSALQAECICC